jgi:hypothetical protein
MCRAQHPEVGFGAGRSTGKSLKSDCRPETALCASDKGARGFIHGVYRMRDKASDHPPLKPLVLSRRAACEFLGGIGKAKFWGLVRAGEIELVGDSNKRWATTASCEAYIERQLAKARAEGPPRGTPRKPSLTRQPTQTAAEAV